MFRAIVAALAVLACIKLGSHVYLYRATTENVIVSAYQARAIEACAREGSRDNLRIPTAAWSDARDISLAIGKRTIDVSFWQVTHELWDARFRSAYLRVIAPAAAATIVCEYDVLRDAADVHVL
ncbi:MAG: hypothetical protein ACFCUN_07300 [Hyphomicrobiaceae bacterium]